MMRQILVFDLDGTLINSMANYAAGMLRIPEEEHIPIPSNTVEIITPLGYTKTAEYFLDLGVPGPVEEIIRRMEKNLVYEYANNIRPKKGIPEFLKEMKYCGAELYVLTASPHIVTDICLKNNGLYDLFDKVWSVEDFGITKGEVRLFHTVADLLHCRPEEICFFDDNLTALQTARRAGCKIYAVYDGQKEDTVREMKAICHDYIETFENYVLK